MRLLVTGKTRSGKSTALHRILSHALRGSWTEILLLDGKGSELGAYADVEGVTYLGPGELDAWATQLDAWAEEIGDRYADLTARGLRQAAPGDPCYLLVADEIQRGTRAPKLGGRIKASLTLLAEQSAALGDVLILTTQRDVNAIPPSTRENMNARLALLGSGYFHLSVDGHTTKSGRVAYLTPSDALDIIAQAAPPTPLEAATLLDILGAEPVTPGRAPATLYLGKPGSGKTHHLQQHPTGSAKRRVYADLACPHKQMLIHVLEQCNAVAPSRASVADLADMAALALTAEPTLLLLDNLDQASTKMLPSTQQLMHGATVVALAANPPRSQREQARLAPFIARCQTEELSPLTRADAEALVEQHLPDNLDDRAATVRRIVDLSNGHPATVVQLATRAQRGTLHELREFSAPGARTTVNLSWLVIVPLFVVLYLARFNVDSYWLGAIALIGAMLIRPFVMQSLRGK